MTQHVFVYGTLMSASRYPASRKLSSEAEFVGLAWLSGFLYDFSKWPGLILTNLCPQKVFGELHRLSDRHDTLRWMDIYEGITELNQSPEYFRTLTDVFMNDGAAVQAWVYTYRWPVTDGVLIPTGRWERRFGDAEQNRDDLIHLKCA